MGRRQPAIIVPKAGVFTEGLPPGPGYSVNVPQMSVESSYYTWVDQHNTLGLGRKRADWRRAI